MRYLNHSLFVWIIFTYSSAHSLSFSGLYESMKDNTFCRFTECCNADYIPYNLESEWNNLQHYVNKQCSFQQSVHVSGLQTSLSQRMFGQPLVNELVNILSAHREALDDQGRRNRKALVISLHGWSGVGKNYAVSMIAEAIYKKGMESSYVKLFMGKKDFDCEYLQETQVSKK